MSLKGAHVKKSADTKVEAVCLCQNACSLRHFVPQCGSKKNLAVIKSHFIHCFRCEHPLIDFVVLNQIYSQFQHLKQKLLRQKGEKLL